MSIIDNSCKIIVRNEKSVVAHTTNFCAPLLCYKSTSPIACYLSRKIRWLQSDKSTSVWPVLVIIISLIVVQSNAQEGRWKMNRLQKFCFCVILVLCVTTLTSVTFLSRRNLSHARIDFDFKEIFTISTEFDYNMTAED